jgi:hypothetical protein
MAEFEQALEKLPTSIQDFPRLREGGYVYVDKTQHLAPLLQGGLFFISRPRRFGKSLLLSTLDAAFSGHRELFTGLWLEHRYDFQPHPVIRLDFSLLDFYTKTLEQALLRSLTATAAQYDLTLQSDSPQTAFEELILRLSKINTVVVLVDEYDKPITDCLAEDQQPQRQRHQALLRSLYGVIKPLSRHLHLVVLTGVSKIGKLSLFSDLNSLIDISLEPAYSQMFGYSRAEIEAGFPQHLRVAQTKLAMHTEQLWENLKLWYNGYSWDGTNRLYCPFSFLLFLRNPSFRSYWYQSATPSFLIELIQSRQINPLDFEGLLASDQVLSTFDLESLDPISIMFQTGYLTIDQIDQQADGVEYRLSYPNKEVRQGFSRQLLEHYGRQVGSAIDAITIGLRRDLQQLNWPSFFERLTKIYASIPYFIVPEQERHFHAIFHALLYASGLAVQSEALTNRGRIDSVVNMRSHVILFELKIVGTAQEAIDQINVRDYRAQFSLPIYKVGIIFDLEHKNVSDWQVEAG